MWEKFLARVLPDAEVLGFVQAALGYACTGIIAEHVLPIAGGAGANGKSTLLDAVAQVLGDYAHTAPPELIAPAHDEHPTLMADLQGARLVVTNELDDGRRLAEATVEKLTGGDPVKARFKRQNRRILSRHRGVCHVCGQPGAGQVDQRHPPLTKADRTPTATSGPSHAKPCHETKTRAESVAARSSNRPQRRRPVEPHPGLVTPPGGGPAADRAKGPWGKFWWPLLAIRSGRLTPCSARWVRAECRSW